MLGGEHRNCTTGRRGKVYIIQDEIDGCIEIGKSDSPHRRIRAIETSLKCPVRILRLFDEGGMYLERQLHRKFKEHRLDGEWFEPVREILELCLEDPYDDPKFWIWPE